DDVSVPAEQRVLEGGGEARGRGRGHEVDRRRRAARDAERTRLVEQPRVALAIELRQIVREEERAARERGDPLPELHLVARQVAQERRVAVAGEVCAERVAPGDRARL